MLELIGSVVIIGLVYKAVTAIKEGLSSQELGANLRRICTREFGIPERDFNVMVSNARFFNEMKQEAIRNQKRIGGDVSLPKSLATVIHNKYQTYKRFNLM